MDVLPANCYLFIYVLHTLLVSFAKRVLFEGESKLICIIKGLCFQQSFCDFFVGKENLFVYFVVNFLSQVIFVFLLFLGMNVC